jgi:hypothetical protein
MPALSPLLLLLAALPLAASEGGDPVEPKDRHNIRFGYESYGDTYQLTLATPLGGGRTDQSWDDNDAFFVGYYTRIPFVSLGFVGTEHSSKDRLPGLTLKERLLGGRLEAGLSFPLLGPLLRLELMPYAGIADGRLSVDSIIGGASAHDLVTEYGAHLDALGRIGPIQGGLGLGWAHHDSSYDVGLSGGRSTIELEQDAFLWRAILGVVF